MGDVLDLATAGAGAHEDAELMRRWLESRASGRGDVAAYEALYRRHREAVRGRIAHVLGPHGRHLDDVFQETWLEVARATAWRPGSFRGWILTVATRKALDRVALKDSATEVEPAPDPSGAPAPATIAVDAAPSAHDRAASRELLGAVGEVLATVPAAQREAWVMRYVEGLPFEEIAARTGAPEGTAKTRVRLARQAVAEGLAARGLAAELARGEGEEGR